MVINAKFAQEQFYKPAASLSAEHSSRRFLSSGGAGSEGAVGLASRRTSECALSSYYCLHRVQGY